jgi:hypothetical protein
MSEKPILDPCCGGRMFWFNKHNSHVLYCDNREYTGTLCDGRTFEVKPDMVCDVISLPFADESFWHVVFDPPHLTHGGESSWLVKKYGKLPSDWKAFIRNGFNECWRVLKTHGTLVFKWNEDSVTVGEITKTIGREPLYGQKERKEKSTHWMCFMKLPEVEA